MSGNGKTDTEAQESAQCTTKDLLLSVFRKIFPNKILDKWNIKWINRTAKFKEV